MQQKKPKELIIKTFSSLEEADEYRIRQRLQMSDWERFQLFCSMMKINIMLKNARENNVKSV